MQKTLESHNIQFPSFTSRDTTAQATKRASYGEICVPPKKRYSYWIRTQWPRRLSLGKSMFQAVSLVLQIKFCRKFSMTVLFYVYVLIYKQWPLNIKMC